MGRCCEIVCILRFIFGVYFAYSTVAPGSQLPSGFDVDHDIFGQPHTF